jgi:hypothetical protein
VQVRAQQPDAPQIQGPTFFVSAFSPAMLAKFSLGVLYDQATVQVPQWGSGAGGLQKRAELRMAGLLSRASVEYGVARFRETDPGYTRCQCRGFGPRSRHALVSEFVEHKMDGSIAAPIARFSGVVTTAAVTSIAEHSGPGAAGQRALLLVSIDAGFNMLQEFWPEIHRTLLLRRK